VVVVVVVVVLFFPVPPTKDPHSGFSPQRLQQQTNKQTILGNQREKIASRSGVERGERTRGD
jgi:hypothetical protein